MMRREKCRIESVAGFACMKVGKGVVPFFSNSGKRLSDMQQKRRAGVPALAVCAAGPQLL
jgi:hypothetical protein